MKAHRLKLVLFILFLMLSIFLLMPTFQLLAQQNPSKQPDQTVEPTSPAEIDSHLAGMSDEQVRQAYAQKLKQDAQKRSTLTQAAENGRSNKVFESFYGAAKATTAVLKHLGGGDGSDVQWGEVVAKLSAGKGVPYFFGTILGLAVIIALGLVLRWLFHRRHPAKLNQCRTTGKITFFRKGPFTHTAGCHGHRCLCSDNIYSFCSDLPGGKTEL